MGMLLVMRALSVFCYICLFCSVLRSWLLSLMLTVMGLCFKRLRQSTFFGSVRSTKFGARRLQCNTYLKAGVFVIALCLLACFWICGCCSLHWFRIKMVSKS